MSCCEIDHDCDECCLCIDEDDLGGDQLVTCVDCATRVQVLWDLVADEGLPYDELPEGWEQRCARHAGNDQ